MSSIYLDHNATTPLDSDVAEAMLVCEREFPANPSSQHAPGRRARAALDDASDSIARILGLRTSGHRPDRLVFTSGGTEANNLALFGLTGPPGCALVTSSVEHPSVVEPAAELARRGCRVDQIRVDRDGRIDLDHLAHLLSDDTRLVSIQLANHETGVLQPVAEATEICAARGIPLHTDAVQAVGKIPVDFTALGAAALSAAAHKFHGPRGIGVLALSSRIELQPLLYGGFQQAGLRPGTESLSLVVGMRVALEKWHRDRVVRQLMMAALRDELEIELRSGFECLVVHGAGVPRLPQTSNVSIAGIDRQALLIALDLAGVACSTGSACASGSAEPSPVLRAMGCNDAELASALRFSLGASTTATEVREAACTILKVCNDLRTVKPARKIPQPSRGRQSNSL